MQLDSKLKTIESVDKQASKLLKERRHSVAIDRDMVEGMLTEMQTEMEHLTRLANFKSDESADNESNDAGALLDDLELSFHNIANLMPEVSYCTDDTLEIATGKLSRIQVLFLRYITVLVLFIVANSFEHVLTLRSNY